MKKVFVPSRGFLFFYEIHFTIATIRTAVFVPSRGFLFFYSLIRGYNDGRLAVFVPSRGFLFFYINFWLLKNWMWTVFVPSRGFLFFYKKRMSWSKKDTKFSSPHGDFSFSIFISDFFYLHLFHRFRPLTGISLFLYSILVQSLMILCFRPLTGISLFL